MKTNVCKFADEDKALVSAKRERQSRARASEIWCAVTGKHVLHLAQLGQGDYCAASGP